MIKFVDYIRPRFATEEERVDLLEKVFAGSGKEADLVLDGRDISDIQAVFYFPNPFANQRRRLPLPD